MSDTMVAAFPGLIPAARHSDRAGGLSAADLIARLTGDLPQQGRRSRRRAADEAAAAPLVTAPPPVAAPASAPPAPLAAVEPSAAPEPPAGLTGSFFTGGGAGVSGRFRAVAGSVPTPLRSPRVLAAAATVSALGATAAITGMPSPAEQLSEVTGAFQLAAADTVLPGLTGDTGASDPGAAATGADVASAATQVLPAVPQVGPGEMGGSVQSAMGAAMGTLPQVLDHATTAQAEVVKKADEAKARADALRKAAAGASVSEVIGGVSGLGAKALAAAQTRLGMPYQWGATGPNAFDCSGLTSWAFKQAGITLPRTSAAQSTFGTAVAKGDMQPGDLVFFYSPVSHVGIYMGNGKVLHASTSGEPVKISNVSDMPFHNARRV